MYDDLGFSIIRYWGYFVFIYMAVLSFFTAWLAQKKNYNYGYWLLLGFFFGIIALLTVGFAPINEKAIDNQQIDKPKKRVRFGGINDEI